MLLKKIIIKQVMLISITCFIPCKNILCQEIEKLSAEYQAVLLAKTLPFYLNASAQISVFVLGSDKDFVNEVKKIMNKSKIKEINIDTKLPETTPGVVYLTDNSKIDEVLKYTTQKRILSASSDPNLVSKGISLSFGMIKKNPRIILNEKSSEKENVKWNPTLLNNPLIIKK